MDLRSDPNRKKVPGILVPLLVPVYFVGIAVSYVLPVFPCGGDDHQLSVSLLDRKWFGFDRAFHGDRARQSPMLDLQRAK